MASRPPPDFQAFIAAIARQLGARNVPFMLIGGQAVLLHGRPRLTEDIDVTLGVGPDAWQTIRDVCIDLQLVPLPDHVEAFVRETFVLPARHTDSAAVRTGGNRAGGSSRRGRGERAVRDAGRSDHPQTVRRPAEGYRRRRGCRATRR